MEGLLSTGPTPSSFYPGQARFIFTFSGAKAEYFVPWRNSGIRAAGSKARAVGQHGAAWGTLGGGAENSNNLLVGA